MEKNTVLNEDSENLGTVIKHLIDFDAQQRELISTALNQREAQRKELEAQRSEINEKYMLQAEKALEALAKKENEKADREINAIRTASQKNIAELEKKAAENSDFWVKQLFEQVINEE